MSNRIELADRAEELRHRVASWEEDYTQTRRRLDELDREYEENRRRHAVVLDQQQRLDAKIVEAREEIQRIEALLPNTAKPKPAPQPVTAESSDTKVREFVLRYQMFTVAELQGVLHLSKKDAEAAVATEVERGIIRATGQRFQRSDQYEYIPPDDPGEAFRRQQEHRDAQPTDPVFVVDAVAGIGEGYLASLPKDVRKEARRAIRDGWTLLQTGSGHMQLVRNDVTITFAKTPQNASSEAKKLRSQLNRADGGYRIQRGMAVAGTGKPIGSSSKPGLDRARAQAGKTVRRRGRKGM